MLQNLVKVMAVLKSIGLSLPALLRILGMLETLYPAPDITDANSLRQWIKKVVDIVAELAVHTETKVDDQVVDALNKILANDTVWEIVAKAIAFFVTKDATVADSLLNVEQAQHFAEADDKAGVSPGTIAMIVSLVVQLIKLVRDRKA